MDIDDGFSERQVQLKVFGNDFLAVIAEEPVKDCLDQSGWDSSGRHPVGLRGKVEFHQSLSQDG
jgi:hypothetical protein